MLAASSDYISHYLLKNYRDALLSIDSQLKNEPQNPTLVEAKIVCLAHLGHEADVVNMLQSLPKSSLNDDLLEEICWAFIMHGAQSTAPQIRFEALLAGFQSQDARAIALIKTCLQDPDVSVRSLAFHAASQFRDSLFHEDALYAVDNDSSIQVRKLAIEVLGTSHTVQSRQKLMDILSDATRTTDEKISAMNTLCNLMYTYDAKLLLQLFDSNSSYLRALGWRIVAKHPESAPPEPYFTKQETSEDVLIEKLFAIPRTTFSEHQLFIPLLQSQNFRMQAVTAWYFLLQGDHEQIIMAQKILERLLLTEQEEAILASAILAHVGPQGLALSEKHMTTHKDPHVRINLAKGLIQQQVAVKKAARVIHSTLSTNTELIDTQQFLYFEYIAPNQQNHVPWLPSYPETKDLLTRLELFSVLTSCNEPISTEELALFLKNKAWGIVFQASKLLLEEWPSQAKDTLQSLLTHKDNEVRLQASIILSFTYQDKAALKILHDSYPEASRMLKEQILMAIAVIGSRESIPFLLQAFQEPSQKLRIQAASAIQRCLNY